MPISSEAATLCTEMMAVMRFFPSEDAARGVIGSEVQSMCETDEQARWLAIRMIRLYREWPGVQEMRSAFCSKYRPRDGVESTAISEFYPDGIPSEHEAPPLQLTGKRDKQISAAPSVEAMVRDLVELKDLNRMAPPKPVRDIPVRNLKPGDMITQDQIDEAVTAYRAGKAAEEAKSE